MSKGESRQVFRWRRFLPTQFSFQIVVVATVGFHERERSDSDGGPPGSRSRHLESVSRKSTDVHQCPDLLAGRSAMSTNVHWRPLTFDLVARQLARTGLVSVWSHRSVSRGRRWGFWVAIGWGV